MGGDAPTQRAFLIRNSSSSQLFSVGVFMWLTWLIFDEPVQP
jgi:hypothetical protein